MKKIMCLLLCLVLLSGVLSVTAYAATSGPKNSPPVVASTDANAWVSGSTYSLTSDAKTVTGANAEIKFPYCGTLQGNFVSSNSRKLYVQLIEDDVIGYDHVKTYVGSFVGRKVDTVVVKTYVENGNIEVTGDNTGEFYINFQVKKVSGDPSTPSIASGLIQYNIYLN